MKTIKYLSIFVLAILSFNCSKSDDSPEAPVGDLETLILGGWKIASKTLNGEAVELDCANGLSTILTFRDADVSFGVDLEDGNGCVTLPFSASYSVEGNTLIINGPFGDIPLIWTVISINETTFRFTDTSLDNADEVYTETYQKI